MTSSEVQGVIALNATFMTELTRVLLPILEKNAHSLIMNISSFASIGMPWLSIYSSSKGYVDSFSRALSAEMRAEERKKKGDVRTGNHDVEAGVFTPTARQMARAALGRVGCGRSLVCGYWGHAVRIGFVEWLPERVVWALGTKVLRGRKDAEEKGKRE